MPSPGYAELLKKNATTQSMPRLDRSQQQQSSAVQSPTSPRSLPPRRFSGYSLRPLPPHRVNFADSAKNNVKLRKKGSFSVVLTVLFCYKQANMFCVKDVATVFDQEETELLKVVESYCTNASTKTGILRSKIKFLLKSFKLLRRKKCK